MTSPRRAKHRRAPNGAGPHSAQTAEEKALARLRRALRKAERRAGDGSAIGGTGATVLKLQAPPVARLLDKGRIGAEEVRAADEIAIAFQAQAGALKIKSPALERRHATHNAHEPVFVIDTVARYKRWATHWSARARRHADRTLEVVIAAVIDERAFHTIEADLAIRHGVAARVVISGLRDYAARAGWTDRRTAEAWLEAAETAFPVRKRIAGGASRGVMPSESTCILPK